MGRLIIYMSFFLFFACGERPSKPTADRPNILFCIADDWSYPHAGAYGDKIARTPHFDRIAREGILFTNAFTAASSCSPSRAAILTGQEIYRLEAGGCLFGTLPQKFPIYTRLMADAGYVVGHTGKGYGPADLSVEDWDQNPAGEAYQDELLEAPEGIRNTDYAANFAQFLLQKDADAPFCFWYGASEPHRRYQYGIGMENGYNPDQITPPAFLPDAEATRNDMADYYYEVEWFDDHLGKMITLLEERGELENTVIVVTSDNGMPFPRAKSNLYNYGDQMPLAIRWDGALQGSVVDLPVSLTDLAPTFLELAQIKIPADMTGKSLVSILNGSETKLTERPFVVTALERHTIARPNNWGYPMRAIHTKDFTYIYNFEPDRWPAGDPDIDAWPQGFYGDVDDGASKALFEEFPDRWPDLFALSFGKRPQEELFHVREDLVNMNNLANDPDFIDNKTQLKQALFDYLKETGDPRIEGSTKWDNYLFTGGDTWEH